MSEEQCGTCRFWGLDTCMYLTDEQKEGAGVCRRRAPHGANPHPRDPRYTSPWPGVYRTDWCGEWESTCVLDEETFPAITAAVRRLRAKVAEWNEEEVNRERHPTSSVHD